MGRIADTTDYSKPFTLKVVKPRYTFFRGELRYDVIHVEQFATPEAMMAEASKYDGTGAIVWTFEPEVWVDTRAPRPDLSFDADDIPRDQRRVGPLPFEPDEEMPF